MIDRIIFATTNNGKIREIRRMLADTGLPVLSLADLGTDNDVDENGATFTENALIKAQGLLENHPEKIRPDDLILADDSGIEIDAMPGELGVHSARFLGEETSYEEKMEAVLARMKDLKGEERSARYVCAIVGLCPDGSYWTAEGRLEGMINDRRQGTGGFGYDPIFFLPEQGKTTAELTMEGKNRISHRGKALLAVREKVRSMLSSGE